VTVALNGHDGLVITESEGGVRVTFSRPVRCLYCAVLIGLKNGEPDIQEDERVRRVQYR
jgi:hypothetical protein